MNGSESADAAAASAPAAAVVPAAATAPSSSSSSDIATPAAAFQVGETLSVKGYGNAVVVAGPIQEPGQFQGRYQVRYPDGLLYHAKPNRLRRFEAPPARVIVAETTDHYRAAAQSFCHPGDVVLEVGSSYGVTCDLIHQRGAQVVGVDAAWELVKESRAKYPHLRFETVDAFDLEAIKALSPQQGKGTEGTFDKICIDIGGIAELHTVMSLVGLYFRTFRRAVLIVKSKYLKNLLGSATVYVPPLEHQAKQQSKRQQQHQQHQQELRQQQQQQQQRRQQQEAQARVAQETRALLVESEPTQQLQSLSLHECGGSNSCNGD